MKRFLNEASQTTRLFDGKVLADEETMNEFNEALDCALRDVEHANTEGDPQTHMFDLLTCFNAAINAVLVRDCGGVRQRRQARYLSSPSVSV